MAVPEPWEVPALVNEWEAGDGPFPYTRWEDLIPCALCLAKLTPELLARCVKTGEETFVPTYWLIQVELRAIHDRDRHD